MSECNVEKLRRGLLDSSLSDKEAQQLHTLAGQLNWTSSEMLPDVSYQAREVSTSIKDATINDFKIANKNIRKLKSTEVVLQFPSLGNLESLYITCFSDASVANLKSGASQGGFVIFLCGSEKFLPIAWKSRKLKRVVESTSSAETLALEEVLEFCFMGRSLFCEVSNKEMHPDIFPICYICYTDHKSLVQMVNSTKTLTEKQLKVDICIIREMIEKHEVKQISWCDSSSQLADCLTKAGASCEKLLRVLQGNAKLF